MLKTCNTENLFGYGDGGCETVLIECGKWLASLDDVSENDRTVKFSSEYRNGEYLVLVNTPNGDEFCFTASDYKDMFYYMNKICERIKDHFIYQYWLTHVSAYSVDFTVNGYLNVKEML